MMAAVRAKIRRQLDSAECVVCGTWTFLTPCSGDRGHDPDGYGRLRGRIANRIARWLT